MLTDFNTNIFKAYDIRGIYGIDFDDEFASILGAAFVDYLRTNNPDKELQLLVGQDVRINSKTLSRSLIAGMAGRKGVVVHDLGLATMPFHFFSINNSGFDGGIMVTASHNPVQYGGFKLAASSGKILGASSGLLEIKKLLPSTKKTFQSFSAIKTDRRAFFEKYIDFLSGFVEAGAQKLKIVVDGGGGAAGEFLSVLAVKAGLNFIPMYWEPDSNFEKHSPNPFNKNDLARLSQAVRDNQADFGCVFDDDGDRILFIDEKGELALPDSILALLADNQQSLKGNFVVVSANMSKSVKELILKKGGQVGVSKVGRSYLAQKMQELSAVIGGEISGHYYFKEFFGGDSGILTLLKVMNVTAKSGKKFSENAGSYRKYFKSEEISIENCLWQGKIEALKQKYPDAGFDEIDGLTIEYASWWANIRPSNTEPLVRFVVEAEDEKVMEQKTAEIGGVLKQDAKQK